MLGAVETIRVGRVEAAARDAPMTAQTRAAGSSEFLPGNGETGLATAIVGKFQPSNGGPGSQREAGEAGRTA